MEKTREKPNEKQVPKAVTGKLSMDQPRRTNPKPRGKKRKYLSRAERVEMACSIAYLESLQYNLRLTRRDEKRHKLMFRILRDVHEKNGCKDYVR